jgi:hypothetical protein
MCGEKKSEKKKQHSTLPAESYVGYVIVPELI